MDPTGYATQQPGFWAGVGNSLYQGFTSFSLWWRSTVGRDPDAAEKFYNQREELRSEAASNSGSGNYRLGGIAGSTAIAIGTVLANPDLASEGVAEMESASVLRRPAVAGSMAMDMPHGPLLRPGEINFSQRTVNENVAGYRAAMANGTWDWSRSGPLRVMNRDGHWVSYDNRRLLAAQQAGLDSVTVEIVSGSTWDSWFTKLFSNSRNVDAGVNVPNGGLKDQPAIAPSR